MAQSATQTEAEGNGNGNLREVEDDGDRKVDAFYNITGRHPAALYVRT